ncbi:MAG: phosphotransferase family protein [Janthinobacterium lividum]
MKKLEPSEIRDAVAGFLNTRIPGASRLVVELSDVAAKAGFSAETVMFEVHYVENDKPVTRQMVLRRQIFGHDLTFDADLSLQWKAMQAMKAHSSLPIPPLVGIDYGHDILGGPFLIMERLPGQIVPQNPNYHVSGWLADLPVERRQEVFRNGIEMVARIHQTDWREGFEFLDMKERGPKGLPQYLSWIEEWLHWALKGRPHPVAEAAMAFLKEKAPNDAPINVLWGDAIPANLLFDENNEVTGVIDWEFAALAPGEIDLGWWMYFDELFSSGFGIPRLEGLPDRATMISIYENALGRKVQNFEYYELIAGLRMTIVSIRAVDRVVAFGRLPVENDAWLNNPSSAWVARRLGREAVVVGPDFKSFTQALFGKH